MRQFLFAQKNCRRIKWFRLNCYWNLIPAFLLMEVYGIKNFSKHLSSSNGWLLRLSGAASILIAPPIILVSCLLVVVHMVAVCHCTFALQAIMTSIYNSELEDEITIKKKISDEPLVISPREFISDVNMKISDRCQQLMLQRTERL